MLDYFIYGICFLGMAAGSITDLRTREVPDWINYAMIISGFSIRLIYSIIERDPSIFLRGLFGFLIFLAIAFLLYYSGQWGGGDAKMLMGVGALMGIGISSKFYLEPLAIFIVNLLIAGGLYGLIWSIGLMFRDRKDFMHNFRANMKVYGKYRKIIIPLSLAIALSTFLVPDIRLKVLLALSAISVFTFFYIWVAIRSVENVSLTRMQDVDLLTEGDWLIEDVIVGGKKICGPGPTGLSKDELNILKRLKDKGKLTQVRIKEGIPFIPSFLFALIITLLNGSIINLFITYAL